MINLEFTPQQVEELKIYYNSELEKIQKRKDEIRLILEKFNGLSESVNLDLHQSTEKSYLNTEIDKSKLKSWSDLIYAALGHNGEALDKDELLKRITQIRGVELSKKNISSINQKIFTLILYGNIESLKQEGKRQKKYRLTPSINKPEEQIKKKENIKEIKKTIVKRGNYPPRVTTYNWTQFVTSTLQNNQRIMQAKDFLQIAMKHFQIPERHKKLLRGRISTALSRLEHEVNLLNSVIKNENTPRYYGLPNWFDEKGKIKSEYKEYNGQ